MLRVAITMSVAMMIAFMPRLLFVVDMVCVVCNNTLLDKDTIMLGIDKIISGKSDASI